MDSILVEGGLSIAAWEPFGTPHGILYGEGAPALDGEQLLEVFIRGALGRSGRKRSRGASRFLGGQGGFLTASTVMAAIGMAWGLYDSLKGQPAVPSNGAPVVPAVPAEVLRVVRLAVSAASADGHVADDERALILQHSRRAGVETIVDEELRTRRPLGEIVSGVASATERRDLYVLAYTIVRADETVSGAERIYLAQLAHALGLDAAGAAALEQQTATHIDGAASPAPQAP